MTRYVMIGAGAVGGAIGGLLVRSGATVLLVARGEHARRVRSAGLVVRCPDDTFTVQVEVATGPEDVELRSTDVLVLTTKTHQAAVAVNEWADVSVRAPDGSVAGRAGDLLPLVVATNGVAAEEIALRHFTRVFAACVWFPSILVEPGEVIVQGTPLRGAFHVGRYGVSLDSEEDTRLLTALHRDWAEAGLIVRVPKEVMAWKYRKLLENTGNALQALLGVTSGTDDLRQAAQAEAREILVSAGLSFVGDDEAHAGWHPAGLSFQPVPGTSSEMGGSTWQSMVRGSDVETDFINGEISLIARHHGLRAPINHRLTALVRMASRNHTMPGSMSADDLRRDLAPSAD